MSTLCAAPDLSFPTVLAKFAKFHQDPTDVLLHLMTTPIIFIGYMALGSRAFGPTALMCVALAYFLTLPFQLADEPAVLSATLLLFGMVYIAARHLSQRGWLPSLTTTAVGALGQVFAHWVTGEKAYMDTYVSECRQGFAIRAASLFLEQAYFQMPLVLSVSDPPRWLVAAATPALALLILLNLVPAGGGAWAGGARTTTSMSGEHVSMATFEARNAVGKRD